MTPEEALKRARNAVGQGSTYWLGQGGANPNWLWPWSPADRRKRCDCSGFAAWVYGLNRDQVAYKDYEERWVETRRIVNDAKGDHDLFRQVSDPSPGDLLVYGDRGKRQGHVGIISRLDGNGRPDRVIHCNASTKDAIAETAVAGWWYDRGAIYARPVFLNELEEEDEEMERTVIVVDGVRDHAFFNAEEGRNYVPITPAMKAALARAGYKIGWEPKSTPKRVSLTSQK